MHGQLTIATIMGFSREEVETAWTPLRNRFVTERRKIRCIPTGSAATTEWRFFERMSFLEEHGAVRKTLGNVEMRQTSNVQQSSEEINDVIFETEESQDRETVGVEDNSDAGTNSRQPAASQSDILSETPYGSLSATTSSTSSHKGNIYSMKRLKKRKNDSSSFESSIVSTLGTMENILKCINSNDEDEDFLFGKSIGSSLKLLKSRKIKARAKSEICEILEKYEED